MYEAYVVGFLQREAYLAQHVNGARWRHWPMLVDELLQVDAFEMLHHVEGEPARPDAVVVHLNGVGAAQVREHLGFACEAADVFFVDLAAANLLERRDAPEPGVSHQPQLPHRAFAKL